MGRGKAGTLGKNEARRPCLTAIADTVSLKIICELTVTNIPLLL